MTLPPAVEMRAIVKRFPGVIANDHVSFVAARGEIHALLGENGAGKSTLMSILAGLYRPDEGQIFIQEQPVEFASPRDAIRAGVGMVYQHFMLVPSQTVAENIILGLDSVGILLNLRQIEAQVAELGQRYGLPVDPRAKVWQLSVGEQQRVELLKMLYRGAQILILDEPTAVLTPQEITDLFRTLRTMAADGKTIILISHKLDEVLSLADRITVLQGGKSVATIDARQSSKAELARLMVGREVLFQLEKATAAPREVRLLLRDVHARDDKGLPALRGLSLQVHSGEIVGLAGVAGNGQQALAEVISRLRPVTSGLIEVSGKAMTEVPPLVVIEAGVAYIPEDRRTMGTAPNLSVAENLALKAYRSPPLSGRIWLNRKAIRSSAATLVEQFQIATPTVDTPVRTLSGGNLQKVILARELSEHPAVIVAAYPSRGLDIGATQSVHQLLLRERDAGAAILLISEDLDELVALSDRIAVIYTGQIVGELASSAADAVTLGLLMAGATLGGNEHGP